jgi:fatty-acyl-CoA synthase
MDPIPGLRDLSPHWLDRLAEIWPDRVALVTPDDGGRYRFDQLRDRATAVAGALRDLGVGRGDRVVALMHNGVEQIDLFFACGLLGVILVPLNWRLSPPELARLIDDTEPALMAVGDEFLDLAHAAAPRVPAVEEAEVREMARRDPVSGSPDVRMDDPWMILYTGGTTGVPKGAVLTHGSITWNAVNTLLSWGITQSDVGPSFTPMFHTGGWNVFTLPFLLAGARVILPRRFDPAAALRLLEEERPTLLFLVPTMFQVVGEQPGFDRADLSSIRWVISGGAPLPEPVIKRWERKVRIFKQGYGLTEAGPNNFATSDEDALRKRGSTVGKPTLFVQMRIVDDEGREVPAGEAGELLLAGPHLFAGYWRRPDATAEALRGGWLHTGDVARCDGEGFYHIVDRKQDMIISGGENIYPAEVEAVLYEHEAVRECAVVGKPDPIWGEAVTAVVSLTPGHTLTEGEIRDHCRDKLARYKVPKSVVLVDDLPKNAAGKILRTEARKLVVPLGERSTAP